MLAAHQRQFDLVLHILDVEGAALADAAGQGSEHFAGELFDGFMDTARGGGGVALNGEEGLGHGDRNLAGVEGRYGAVATDHLHRRLARRHDIRFGRMSEHGRIMGV